MMKKFREGLSLIELIVVFLITILISGAVFGILTAVRTTAGISRAKGEAKSMSEVVLRQLDRDISASQATIKVPKLAGVDASKIEVTRSFTPTADGCTMKIPKGDNYEDLTYVLSNKVLTRTFDGKARPICKSVEKLVFTNVLDFDEQISVELEIGVTPSGATTPQVHHQTLLISIREAQKKDLDARWRSSDDVVNNLY